ncbi:hypothetical protein BGV52_06875 [Burkholderia ubonensis]|nr:hypothetical protein BGV52_06875 [Burkholderia ubonensis]OJB48717.1 hypothetical protein BGV61_30525 [Burkholderia ubonensis]
MECRQDLRGDLGLRLVERAAVAAQMQADVLTPASRIATSSAISAMRPARAVAQQRDLVSAVSSGAPIATMSA